jgi:hypothetical protein
MRKISGLNYIFGIIVLIVMAGVTYYAQNLSLQLVVFFGFVTGYLAAVLVLFWILGRVGA